MFPTFEGNDVSSKRAAFLASPAPVHTRPRGSMSNNEVFCDAVYRAHLIVDEAMARITWCVAPENGIHSRHHFGYHNIMRFFERHTCVGHEVPRSVFKGGTNDVQLGDALAWPPLPMITKHMWTMLLQHLTAFFPFFLLFVFYFSNTSRQVGS